MTTNYVKISSSPDGQGGKGSLWATAGDVGTPCPANWDEFTRTVYDNSNPLDRGNRAAAVHGVPILLTDAEWAAEKQRYTTPVPVGTIESKLVIDDATIAKWAKANAVAFFKEQKEAGN